MIPRRAAVLGALAAPALARPAQAEASTVRIAKQYGLPYLPIMVMEHEHTNPKVTEAVLAAQEEANALMTKQPGQAAAIYIEMARDTRTPAAEMARFVADPDNDWTTVPNGVEKMAEFMHKVGRLRRAPASWKAVYMPEVHGLPGS